MAKKEAKKKVDQKAKKAAMPRTYVTLLLDRSGSMDSIKSATIEGFNTFLSGLQADKVSDIRFTFLQFDTESLDKVCVAEPVGEVPLLTNATFVPRGGTPLIDSVWRTIAAVEEALARDVTLPLPRVILAIQTDGEENASHSVTWERLSAKVREKQELGWQFNFLGAGIDAYKQAAQMSIATMDTLSYGTGLAETRGAFAASASNSVAYAAGRSANTAYTVIQKQQSGDVFDPALFAGNAPKGK